MKKFLSTGVIITALLSGGCSTFSQTVLNKSVIEDDLPMESVSTLAMTADRRLAIVKPVMDDSDNIEAIRICAEALPDVAKATELKSSLDATLEALEEGSITVGTGEELKEILEIVYQRTEKSDLVRQLGWQVCQGYMNEALGEEEYYNLLQMIIVASIVEGDTAVNAFQGLR